MKRKHPHGICPVRLTGFLSIVLVCVIIAATALAQVPSGGAKGSAVELSERDKKLCDLLVIGAGFRNRASGDIDGAIQDFSSKAFQDKWNKEIAPNFIERDPQWEDFFSSAILFGGRALSREGVIIFYNPWSDVGFIAAVDSQEKEMTDFFVLVGERIRGETMTQEIRIPSWERKRAPIGMSIGDLYLKTQRALSSAYPLDAPFKLLPSSLTSGLEEQENELVLAKMRFQDRIDMFLGLVRAEDGSKRQQAMAAIGKMKRSQAQNDKKAFRSLFSADQDRDMLDTVFSMETEQFSRLAPNYYYEREGGAIVAVVDPAAPQWFATISYRDAPGGKLTVGTIELYKFELMPDILQAYRAQGGSHNR